MHSYYSFFVLLLPILILTSCDTSPLQPEDLSEIAQAQARWETRSFESYTIDQSVFCFCPGPHSYTIEVSRDSIVDIHIDPDQIETWGASESALKQAVLEKAFTINEVFALIAKNLNSAYELEVTYDPRYGYPDEVYIDRIKNAVDEEVTIRMSNLRF